jgi:hypothetical protein
MHFSFNLLQVKGLYIFRTLLAHLQEALNKRHLVYCVRVMLVGSTSTGVKLQSWCCQLTGVTRNISSTVGAEPPEDEQIMFETCRGP